MNTKNNIHSLTVTALSISLLCACSYIVIPLPFASAVLSFHTVIVNLIALTLKPKNAVLATGTYLLMGLLGLPVFSSGTSGVGKLFGPTGGFYFGFLAAVILMSLLKGKSTCFRRYLGVTLLVGLPAEHFFAVLFMCIHNGFDVKAAFMSISLPFLLTDIFKCVLSSFFAVRLNKAMGKGRFFLRL